MKRKIPIRLLFILSLVFIFRYTMLPEPSLGIGMGKGEINLLPLIGLGDPLSPGFMVNVGGNIVLFIPLGIILPIMFPKIRNPFIVTFIGFYLSIMIECIQLTMPNRWTDINDVILNTWGTFIGGKLVKKFK